MRYNRSFSKDDRVAILPNDPEDPVAYGKVDYVFKRHQDYYVVLVDHEYRVGLVGDSRRLIHESQLVLADNSHGCEQEQKA